MLTVLVCDLQDEVTCQIRQNAMDLYKSKIKLVKKFKNEESILFYLEDHKDEKHIVFIDIHFNFNKGIPLAARIKRLQKNISVVFMSKEVGYYPAVYDVEHEYFLRKPLDSNLVNKALEKAIIKLEKYRGKYLVAITKSEVHMIPLTEIVFIEKEKRKVHVIDVNDSRISFYSCFDELENQLNNEFYRCHNSYIINLQKIVSVDSKSVLMDNGDNIPVSRTHIKDLKTVIKGYNVEQEIV